MALENIITLIGDGITAIVIFELFVRRAYRLFPIFFSYLIWGILSDVISQWAAPVFYPSHYRSIYLGSLIIDLMFQFGVLVEVAWSVLRPLRSSLPKWTPIGMAAVIALIAAAIWPLTTSQGLHDISAAGRLQVHTQETFSFLRILFFVILAGCSQLLSIGWRDRELQIATGFGFYSMVSLGVSMLHTTGQPSTMQYHLLDEAVSISYICSLVYWIACFAAKEVQRREFTPQMENLLLGMAGAARSTRLGLSNTKEKRERDRRE